VGVEALPGEPAEAGQKVPDFERLKRLIREFNMFDQKQGRMSWITTLSARLLSARLLSARLEKNWL
jgi:hypothetical protein